MVNKNPSEQLLETLNDYCLQEDIKLEQGVLVAASGGTDSTALLTLLASYRDSPGIPFFPLYGVYVDHRLREADETETEWQLLLKAAKQLKVPVSRITLGRNEIATLADNSGEGIEAAARELRYEGLEMERQRLDCAYLALGHTLDDLTETMITRFMQGVGISGLHGIPPRRGKIIRPLLSTGKKVLAAYLSSCGIHASEDSSNLLPLYQRNRVRKRIIPVLLAEFPEAATSLYKAADIYREENELLEELTRNRLPWEFTGNYARISADLFLEAPRSMQIRSLLKLVNHFIPGSSRVSRNFLASIPKPQSGGEAILLQGRGFTLKKVGGELEFLPSVVFTGKSRYVRRICWEVPGIAGQFKYSWYREPAFTSGEIYLPDLVLSAVILLRSCRLSDQIKTESGTKKLADIFSDQHIPVSLRDRIPVLQVGDRTAAVFGSLYGYQDRIAAEFRTKSATDRGSVLRIELVE